MSKRITKNFVENISFNHQVKRDGDVEEEPDALIEIETKIYGDLFLENEDDFETKEIGEAKAYIYDFDRFYCRNRIRPGMVVSGYLSDIKNNFGRFLIDPETGFYSKRFLKTINKIFGLDLFELDSEGAFYSLRRIILLYARRTYPDYRGNGITQKYYENLNETFRPDLIVTYPFPLQFSEDNPVKDEFGLSFEAATKKLRSIYAKAGMKPLYDGWMGMIGDGYSG